MAEISGSGYGSGSGSGYGRGSDRQKTELNIIKNIPRKGLPLYIGVKWEFEENKSAFGERFK